MLRAAPQVSARAWLAFSNIAVAQAPIQERSEAVATVDGALRSADVARNAVLAAETRRS